ncbi:MAG: leucyl aminopeptidase family protein [Gammaproteobacteria bacterium]|nr:leucyl aminopeptidase family protein [Gammaproteobacteria bacterium]
MECFYEAAKEDSILITLFTKSEFDELTDSSLDNLTTWLLSSNRSIQEGNYYLVPDEQGKLNQVVVIVDNCLSIWTIANLPLALPAGNYYLTDKLPATDREKLAIGWGLGSYQFSKYKKSKQCARLLFDSNIDQTTVLATINSTYIVRDLINEPANEMMPEHLSHAAQSLAIKFNASFSEVVGDDLISNNYPLIHAVGRASEHEPRLIKIEWGKPEYPLLCVAGKGVCFDSGGLNIKNATGMRWMKKDMGGAAHALGLANYIMETNLPVRLQVLIPAVENAISNNAYRPGDVVTARSGTSVEIDNTDAEGRLVLADAITELCESDPDLLIDYATLTGAARVALGTEVGVFFSEKNKTAHDLNSSANASEDDIWRLPLHDGYKHQLKSSIADLVNCASSGYGGAITAALFLQSFVSDDCDWLHFDIMAYNMRSRPGRPKGGEAMGLRSVCQYLESRYSPK